MDFELDTEQAMLRDSARRYFEKMDSQPSEKNDLWPGIVALGWPALAVPEYAGGLGGSLADLTLLCAEIGRACSPLPFIGCSVLPARIAAGWRSAPWSEMVLSGIADGSLRPAVALLESGRRYDARARGLRAEPAPGGWRLTGSKVLVAGYAEGAGLLASVSTDDASAPCQGWVFLPRHLPGLEAHTYEAIDGTVWADLQFDGVEIPHESLSMLDADGALALEAALDDATVCQCAQLIGGMERALELTIAHLKVRQQFGQALAQFQSLQHAVAEMSIDINDCRSILFHALAALGGPPLLRARAVSACRIKVMRTAKNVNGMAIHLHGGIGVTCEYPVGHYLRQTLVIERTFGDDASHLRRYRNAATPEPTL